MCCETSWDIKIKKWWCVTIFNHFKGSRTWQEALSTQWIGAAERLKWFFLCDDRSNRISFFGRWLFKSHLFFAVVVHIIFFTMIVQIAFLSGDYRLHCCNFLRWLFTSFFCDHCPDRIFWRYWFIFIFLRRTFQTQFSRIIFGKVRRHQSPNAFLQVAICIFQLPFLIAQLQKRKLYIFLWFVFFDFSSHSIFCIFFGGCAYQT